MSRGGRPGMGEPISVRTPDGTIPATVDWFNQDGSVDYTERDDEGNAAGFGVASAGKWGQR